MVDGGLISGVCDCSMDLIENGGFGASPLRTSMWCIPGRGLIFVV